MDGTIDGWRRSKQFAGQTLRQNSLENIGRISLAGLRLNAGTSNDYWDVNDTNPASAGTQVISDFSGTQGTVGDVWVSVERGAFWYATDANGLNARTRFESWEGVPNGKPKNTEGYLISNAIRVRMRLQNWQTTLGGMFGIGGFSDIEEESVAVADGEILAETFPIGIQVGYLRHNNSPFNGAGNNLNPKIDPIASSADRYLATFAGARSSERQTTNNQVPVSGLPPTNLPTTDEKFEEGYQRYENGIVSTLYVDVPANTPTVCLPNGFPAPSTMNNCKAVEERSTILGTPNNYPAQSINASQLVSAFLNPPRASVGMWFAPMADASGMTTNDGMAAIAAKMNEASNPQFKDFFDRFRLSGSPQMQQLFPRLPSKIPANDPFGRPQGDPNYELLKNFPTPTVNAGGQGIVEVFRRQDMGNDGADLYRFHHPLCFDNRINGGVANDINMRVLYGWASVVDSDEPSVKYTDFRYDGQPQNAIEVVPNSRPRIVGRKKVIVWGGNFRDLDAQFPALPPPAPHIPASFMRAQPWYTNHDGTQVKDKTFSVFNTQEGATAFEEWKRKKRDFDEDLDNITGCYEQTGDQNCDDLPEADDLDFAPLAGSLRRCFDIEQMLDEIAGLIAQFGLDFQDSQQCEDEDDPSTCTDVHNVNSNGHSIADQIEDKIGDYLGELTNVDFPAWEGTFCAHFLLDRSNPNSGDAYEDQMESFYAGLGCAGLEYSVEYTTEATSLATGKTFLQQSPTLVREFSPA